MSINETKDKIRNISRPIAESFSDVEQELYAVQASIDLFIKMIDTAENGEELARKFIAFVSHFSTARQAFADTYQDIKALGKELDPLFKALDRK